MSKLSIQFHAMPNEASDLVRDALRDESIFVVEAVGSPLQFRLWDRRRDLNCEGRMEALAFTLKRPALNVESMDDFRHRNPDVLVLEIGQLTPVGLAESWLSAMTENRAAMTRWRKLARSLQSCTMTGAIAVNPISRATAPMKGHRFTAAAQMAFSKGIAMLPAAGNSLVELPLPNRQ